MADQGNQPTTQTEEDTDKKSTTEQETQRQQQENFQEAAPETGQIDFFLQFAGAVGLVYASKRQEVSWAFEKLNDPNFEHEILKVMDPRKFQELKNALKIAEKELDTQKKRSEKQGKQKDEAEAGVWRLKRKLGFSDFDRKKQAFDVAEAVQNRITATEIKIKLQNASNVYGIELGTLQRGLAQWLRENPGKGLEEYISVTGGKLYREKLAKEGKEPEKDIDKKVKALNKSARKQAVKENREQIIRAQKEVKRTLSLNNNQTISQKEQLLSVLQGTPSPQIQTVPQPVPPPPAPPPTIPSAPVSVPRINIPSISFPKFSFPQFGGAGSFLRGGAKSVFGTGGLLSKGLSGGLNLLKNAGLKGASLAFPPAAAALGAITALDALTGGLITKGAAFLVAGVAAIVVILPLFIGVGVLSYITGSNPMTVSTTAYLNNHSLSWNEFNKQYLTINTDNQILWQQFTEGNLMLDKKYLSLDANRHNDVKK